MRRVLLKNEAITIQRQLFYVDKIDCRERNAYPVVNKACLANRRWPLQPCVDAGWGGGGKGVETSYEPCTSIVLWTLGLFVRNNT